MNNFNFAFRMFVCRSMDRFVVPTTGLAKKMEVEYKKFVKEKEQAPKKKRKLVHLGVVCYMLISPPH